MASQSSKLCTTRYTGNMAAAHICKIVAVENRLHPEKYVCMPIAITYACMDMQFASTSFLTFSFSFIDSNVFSAHMNKRLKHIISSREKELLFLNVLLYASRSATPSIFCQRRSVKKNIIYLSA